MNNKSPTGVEQVAVSRLLDNAFDDFDKGLLSASARFILWGSFSSAGSLAESYLRTKNRSDLLDKRRSDARFSADDLNFRNHAYTVSEEALAFVRWARERGNGQPILREALVSYCYLLESALKNVSLAFRLARRRGGFDSQIFVPGPEFRAQLKAVKDDWSQSGSGDEFRARRFFDRCIVQMNPDSLMFPFDGPPTANDWEVCQAAFDLRNAIVHQIGVPAKQIVIGDDCFHPNWEVELSTHHLRAISGAMRAIMQPIGPYRIDLL